MHKWGHEAQLQEKELPRSGIASEIRQVRDKVSQGESCGRPCDVMPICRYRNSKSIRGRKKGKKNCNIYKTTKVNKGLYLSSLVISPIKECKQDRINQSLVLLL